MAEQPKVKEEKLNLMNWVQAQEIHVNQRAKSVQDACATGNMSNDESPTSGAKTPPMKWNYNTGIVEQG